MKHWHVTVIAVSVFLLLLGCNLGSSTPSGQSAPTPTGAPTTTPTAPAAAQPVKVSLTWDKSVDMDLEIWNAVGDQMIHRAFAQLEMTPPFKGENCGSDIADGSGAEYWIFKRTSTEDFSNGEYIVSVSFLPKEGATITSSTATVTITKPDGSTTTRSNLLKMGETNWHAIKIDATTGNYTVVDKIIDYTTH